MGRDERFALTQDVLDRIDAVVSGHELQRSPESGAYVPLTEIGERGPTTDEIRWPDFGVSYAQAAASMGAALDRASTAMRDLLAASIDAAQNDPREVAAAGIRDGQLVVVWGSSKLPISKAELPGPGKSNVRRYGR